MRISELMTLLNSVKDNHGDIEFTVIAPTGCQYEVEKTSVKTEYFNDIKVTAECEIILDSL